MEAPPGTTGEFTAKDVAWGGCSLDCPKGGVPTCVCFNGVAATGAACAKHASKMCASCDTGFELTSDKTACLKPGVCYCMALYSAQT